MTNKAVQHLHKTLCRDERGVALAIAIMVSGVLVTLSAGFVVSTINELNTAQHYRNSVKAFWMASSGIDEFLHDTHYLDGGSQSFNLGGYSVTVSKDDSSSSRRIVRAEARVGSERRTIEVTFPGTPADLFGNTLTAGHNLNADGDNTRLDANGKVRVGNAFNKNTPTVSANFQDKREGQGADSTTLRYPDLNNNGVIDEFDDFVQYYRNQIATLPANQTVWLRPENPDDDVIIIPNQKLAGKKLIFIDAPQGKGNVDIILDASWASGENLTIVSTGDVTYVQPLTVSKDSKLNLVAWNDYNEASVVASNHAGVTYAHNNVEYYSVLNYSNTAGAVVANHDINASDMAWKVFDFASPVDGQGQVPPGFSGLISQSPGGYSSSPDSWKEI